jgi:hypothetical protein
MFSTLLYPTVMQKMCISKKYFVCFYASAIGWMGGGRLHLFINKNSRTWLRLQKPPIEYRASSGSLWYRFTRYFPQSVPSIDFSSCKTSSSPAHKPMRMVINQCHCFDLIKSTKSALYGLSDVSSRCSITL